METTENTHQTQIPEPSETSQTSVPVNKLGTKPFAKITKLFNKIPKKIQIVAIVAILIISLLFLLILLTSPTQVQPVPLSSPIIAASSSPNVPQRQESEFSQSEIFKSFEQNIQKLEIDSEDVDLTETEMSFPLLDWNVNFSEQF